jgi:hypothetical protein
MKTFARTLAGLGLAAAITIGVAGNANAAIADRGGDAVVLKGADLSDLVGTEPGKIVGFAWDGKWQQIPVQVDERHTVDVRQLYPEGNFPPYVGDNTPDFDLEVYADPKTLSGADQDATFDADDELTFMGGDAGAPINGSSVTAPAGVDPASAVSVAVNDPISGEGGAVYLFEATGDLDPSAGKDYVDYEFKLTNLTGTQTLKDDYGYFSQFNPEDSTVKTDDYELHSIDRWMEDEMKITMGNSTGVDILDREVAQATKTGCGRSEYTFSGRWTQDTSPGNDGNTDTEGTYVAVIDGPVRAIRSYMGANSGPYVQREHIYYQDHEQNTIFLRVHPMLDLYSWTDYSPAAIGMTYRDLKNTGGVPVDGNPDTITPAGTADVANGAYAWQQLSGPQGSVSTVVGSDTDIPNPNFGTYYLDDSTPTASNEVQCGGDGQSIGASGFGILGPVTPNTDPRLGVHNNLTVKRTRYFGPPSDGTAQAENYTERVLKPLAASAAASPISSGRARIKVKLLNKKVKARPGKQVRLKLKVVNNGTLAIQKGTVCLTSKRGLAKKTCKKFGKLAIGKGRTLKVKAKVKKRVKGKRLHLNVGYTVRTEAGTASGGQRGGFNIRVRRKK